MIPAAFDYVRPASLDEALRALARNGGAKALAGGHSLLPLMKLRLARPERLVDVGRLAELRGIRPLPGGGAAVGAATTYDQLAGETTVVAHGAVADALPLIGDVQVRNRGTIGGALAHADPAGDFPALALALGVELVVRSVRGERTVAIDDWFRGPFSTALGNDELLIEIRFPSPQGLASAYVKLPQPASGYAIAGVAVALGGGGGTPTSCRVALTGVGEVAYRARAVEEAVLAGADPATAAQHAVDGVAVTADIHADAAYRSAVARVLTRRALEAALARR
jgi:carbon-monoxide dehydrogenase medium subunit